MTPPQTLAISLIADMSEGERVKRYHPETGRAYLADPETWDIDDRSTWVDNPWPIVGAVPRGETPKRCTVNTTIVDRGVAQGWLELVNPQVVHRPGGIREKPWLVTHTFVHAEAILIKGPDSDVRYRVVRQPDKYHQGPEGTDAISDPTAEVLWTYDLELEG